MSSSQFNFKSSGFKTTDTRFKTTKTVERPIGIKTPLAQGEDFFEMHFNPIKQLSDNFRNLVMTNNGERLGKYNFGANLKSLVFDYSNSPNFNQIVENAIIDAARNYIPDIQILSVEPSFIDKNEINSLNKIGLAKVRIKITFVIPKFKSPTLGLEVDLQVGG